MSKVLFIRIKVLRGNFFLLISNQYRKLIFNKSCGNLGFKNIQKRTKDAYQSVLALGIQYLLKLGVKNKIFIKIEAAKKEVLSKIQNDFVGVLKHYKLNVFAITLLNKVLHNGCRKSYFRN
jgi:ribosomal protein S11